MRTRIVVFSMAALLLLSGCGRSNRDMAELSNGEKAVYCKYFSTGFLLSNDANGLPTLDAGNDPAVRAKAVDFVAKAAVALSAKGGSIEEFRMVLPVGQAYSAQMDPQRHAVIGSKGMAAAKVAMDTGDVDGAAETMKACIDAYHALGG